MDDSTATSESEEANQNGGSSSSLPIITSSFTSTEDQFVQRATKLQARERIRKTQNQVEEVPASDNHDVIKDEPPSDSDILVESPTHARDHCRHLSLLLKQEMWTDFAIHCLDHNESVLDVLNVHRVVLSLHSDLILMSRRPFIRIRAGVGVMQGLIRFMYTGKVHVPQEEAPEYARVAKALKMRKYNGESLALSFARNVIHEEDLIVKQKKGYAEHFADAWAEDDESKTKNDLKQVEKPAEKLPEKPSQLSKHPCKYCPRILSTDTALKAHLESVHGFKSTGEKVTMLKPNFRCGLCGKKLPDLAARKRHRRWHVRAATAKVSLETIPLSKVMKLTGQEPKLDFEGCNKEEIRCSFCGKLCDTHKWKAEHEKWHRLHNAEKSDNLDLIESEEHDLIRTSRCGLKSTFPCAECGKILHSNFKRKLHQRRHQAQRLAAKNNQSMITAQKKKDATPSLDCKTCGIRCPSLKAKAIHVAWHIEMKKKQTPPKKQALGAHNCKYCGEKFSSDVALDDHLSTHPEAKKKHKCDHCTRSFREVRWLATHIIRAHPGQNPYHCFDCRKSFRFKMNFIRHKLESHPEAKDVFPCGKCPRGFLSKEACERHLLSCNGSGLVCKFCQERFTRRIDKVRHMKTCDKVPEDWLKAHTCGMCGMVCSNLNALQRHEEGCENVKCEFCKQKFSRQRTLEAHQFDCEMRKAAEEEAAQETNTTLTEDPDNPDDDDDDNELTIVAEIPSTPKPVVSRPKPRFRDIAPRPPQADSPGPARTPTPTGNVAMFPPHASTNFPCVKCGRDFPNIHLLRQHYASQCFGRCKVCGKTGFTSHMSLKTHESWHKRKDEAAANSGGSTPTFSVRSGVNNPTEKAAAAQESSEAGERLICAYCQGSYASKASLYIHQQSHCPILKFGATPSSSGSPAAPTVPSPTPSPGQEEKVQCNMCQGFYSSKKSLYYHKKNYCPNRPSKQLSNALASGALPPLSIVGQQSISPNSPMAPSTPNSVVSDSSMADATLVVAPNSNTGFILLPSGSSKISIGETGPQMITQQVSMQDQLVDQASLANPAQLINQQISEEQENLLRLVEANDPIGSIAATDNIGQPEADDDEPMDLMEQIEMGMNPLGDEDAD